VIFVFIVMIICVLFLFVELLQLFCFFVVIVFFEICSNCCVFVGCLIVLFSL
jgi:hypothetical protein